MTNKVKISPSILSADFAQLGQEVSDISKAGADYIHIDVMDGHFVPNITIGYDVVKSLKSYTNIPFDVHLMIEDPDFYVQSFVDAGADIVTIHVEAVANAHRSLQNIKSLGVKAGISLCPATPVESIENLIDVADLILVMTVKPGFGGQKFMESQLAKIEQIRAMINRSGRYIELEVDGGINAIHAVAAIKAGADVLVAGSAVFKGNRSEYAANILDLRG